MDFACTLIAVGDMERSKNFYQQLLGMEVTADFGANVTLSHRLALQTMESWQTFLNKSDTDIIPGGHTSELYFEESDMDAFLKKLGSYPGVEYVHGPKEHRWGQRVVRFYDPDRHVIEVGETMTMVALRFHQSGMTSAEIAQRMEAPLSSVLRWLGPTEDSWIGDDTVKAFQYCKMEIFIPETHLPQLQDALRQVDAGHIGNYDSCLSYSRVTGCWRPLEGSSPYVGREHEACFEPELKVEVTCLRDKADETVEAIRAVHPYEVPVINVIPLYRTSF
ncbi:MAG: lactoylglutathione lyase-like lyase [Firmicutes bacterium]|nr:lactoylglutathione lyase-like lyase [Bacillota bacterium]